MMGRHIRPQGEEYRRTPRSDLRHRAGSPSPDLRSETGLFRSDMAAFHNEIAEFRREIRDAFAEIHTELDRQTRVLVAWIAVVAVGNAGIVFAASKAAA